MINPRTYRPATTRATLRNLLPVLAGVAVTLLFRGYQFGESNHTVYLVATLRLDDPTLLRNDWWTTSTLQYHGLFTWLVLGLSKVGLLKAGSLALYLGLALALHAAWLRGVRLLGGTWRAYLLSVGFYYLSAGGFGLGMYAFLQDGAFLPSNVANVAMLGGIVLLAGRRTLPAAACLGVAGMFHLNHALVGGLGWLLLFPVLRDQPRRWAVGGVIVATLSLVTVGPALAAVLERTGGMSKAEFVDLYVRVRHPHHYDPSTWHWALWVAFLWPIPIAVVEMRRRRESGGMGCGTPPPVGRDRPRDPRPSTGRPAATPCHPEETLARVATYFLVLAVVAIFLAGIWYVSETVVQLSLYRFSIYPKWVGCVLAALWMGRSATRAKAAACVVAVGVLGFATARLAIPDLLSRFNPQDDRDYLRLCDWVRENVPTDAVLLVPPGEQSMRLRGRRAIVVNFKGVPQLSSELEAWKERMEGVARIGQWAPLMGRFDVAMREVDRRYDALPADYLRGLAHVYDADLVVARRDIPAFGEPLFTSGPYRLYRVKRVGFAASMIITAQAHARAGLVGNPSDGYFGKTISFLIRNFTATVRLWESPHFEIRPTHGDLGSFGSVKDFLRDVKLHGYYGGMRLIKAAIKKFHDHCRLAGIGLDADRSFTVSFETDIPRLVGLSGSSAIVTATVRALMRFYDVSIPQHLLPTLILSVEKEELNIAAGLQDRVIQVYGGIVYMDFEKSHLEERGYGIYEPLAPEKLPPLYVAYDPARAEISDVPHRNLRELYNRGDPTVHAAMRRYREITDRGRDALMAGDWETLGAVMNENFDLRRTIMNVAPENLRMVEVARETGASAKFAGSGGAIIGLYKDGRQYQQIVDALAGIRCTVLRPMIYEQ